MFFAKNKNNKVLESLLRRAPIMAKIVSQFHDLENFKCNHPKLVKQIGHCSVGPHTTTGAGIFGLIVLAVLFPVQNLESFKTRLAKLLGEKNKDDEIITKEEMKSLYDFLFKYNPFQNSLSCCFNEILMNVAQIFHRVLFSPMLYQASSTSTEMVSSLTDESVRCFLKVVSCALKCNMALCDVTDRSIEIFSATPDKILPRCDLLTLYVECDANPPFSKFYAFGIESSVGLNLQKKALKKILSDAKLNSGTIKRIKGFRFPENNITLTLASKGMFSNVSVLFRKPHLLLKLEEAGYSVNPTVTDIHKKSALYYAIEKGDQDMILGFCFYMASAFHSPNRLYGRMEETVFENLKDFSSILNDLKLKFVSTQTSSWDSVALLEHLMKVNCFHRDMCDRLAKTDTLPNSSDCETSRSNEVNRKRMKMIAILSTYANYFNYEGSLTLQHNSAEVTSLEKFAVYSESFKKNEWYCNILDFCIALLFFDNLFSLKQDLLVENDLCEATESAFFHFIFTRCFYSFKKLLLSPQLKKALKGKSWFYYVSFMERLKCFECLQTFNTVLANTVVTNDNIIESTQKPAAETLRSLPEIRDVVIIRALLRYLNAVSKLKNEFSSNKNAMEERDVLVIERALQVVGESLNETYADNVSLGKSMLISILPMKVRKAFRYIRDKLSHVDGKGAESRIRIEKSRKIFSGIIVELDTINVKLEKVCFILELLECEYMLRKAQSHLKEIHSMLGQSSYENDHTSEQSKTALRKNVGKDIHLLEIATHDIQQAISSFRQLFMLRVQVHFDYVNDYLFERLKMPDRLSKTLFHLDCAKTLLVYCFEYSHEKSVAEKEEVIGFVDDIKRIANDIIKETISIESGQKVLKGKTENIMRASGESCTKKLASETNKTNRPRNGLSFSSKKSKSSQSAGHSVVKEIQQPFSLRVKPRHHKNVPRKVLTSNRSSRTDSLNADEASDYSNIEELARSLQYFYPITEEEQNFILDKVPSKFKENSEAKASLEIIFKSLLIGESSAVNGEIESEIEKLIPSKQKRELKRDFSDESLIKNNLELVCSIKDDYKDLRKNFCKKEMIDRKDFERCCTNLELCDNETAKALLKKCVKGEPFKPQNDTVLKYFRDKVVVLEHLLVKSDPSIARMWEEVKSVITKQQVFFLIKEHYVRDHVLQAAVEMLLFDCMNILKRRTDLKKLWIKTSNLFSGINLRNVLAHGNPLFEQIELMLDPDDLPSEIISKCLELVGDREAIEAMCKIVERTDGTWEAFVSAEEAEETGTKGLHDVIKAAGKWEEYALLLPRASNVERAESRRKKDNSKAANTAQERESVAD